ncbi:hypothetical protein HK103_002091 [Boothiomyces macroporosus]|uniref:Uncharacterized protein n=1 Tax=Boothiomyces macroporosus TaxID=261099 RepID=A0AAD5UJX9_9FUNG|nr:hypothetical protein HK103_002091 [Boothiomyces macroporosus]
MAAFTFVDGLNNFSGEVTIAALLVMAFLNHYKVGFHPKYFVRWMIYLDALAFTFTYITQALAQGNVLPGSGCSQKYIAFVGDFIDSFKDACKYGYLVYRGFQIWGSDNPARISVFASLGSLVLYWLYIATAYSFSGDCSQSLIPQVSFNWSLVLLYVYWMIMDMVPSAIMIIKFQDYVYMAPGNKTISKILYREETRLFISCIVMAAVTCNSIYNVIARATFSLTTVAFVYTQFIIFLNSINLVDENCDLITRSSEDESTYQGKESGLSPSGNTHTNILSPSSQYGYAVPTGLIDRRYSVPGNSPAVMAENYPARGSVVYPQDNRSPAVYQSVDPNLSAPAYTGMGDARYQPVIVAQQPQYPLPGAGQYDYSQLNYRNRPERDSSYSYANLVVPQ